MAYGLENKRAVVTGANGGIGLAIAESMLKENASVILPVHRQGANIDALIEQYGTERVCVLPLDVSDMASINEFAQKVEEKFTSIDILVNNAGISRPAPLEELTVAAWDAVMDTNLKGPFFLTQALLPLLKKAGEASIVNVTSMSGHAPHSDMGAYSASKSGFIILTQQMALEWARYNIRVNAVSPGMIRTPLSEKVHQDEEVLEKRKALTPLKRIGVGQDIAEAVLFLASPRSSFITGHAIVADGGLLCTTFNHIPGRPGKQD